MSLASCWSCWIFSSRPPIRVRVRAISLTIDSPSCRSLSKTDAGTALPCADLASSRSRTHAAFSSAIASSSRTISLVSRRNSLANASDAFRSSSPFCVTCAKCCCSCSSSASSNAPVFGGCTRLDAPDTGDPDTTSAPARFSSTSRRKCSISSSCTSCAIWRSCIARASANFLATVRASTSLASFAHSLSRHWTSKRCVFKSSPSCVVVMEAASSTLKVNDRPRSLGEIDRTGDIVRIGESDRMEAGTRISVSAL
mmetsp:Transcript_55442/g.161031  ORF Transcript_55442/g.161031 Transcript_55442/m.161031 type:complete len:255 (+) Transcript_55442:437-1201(+)